MKHSLSLSVRRSFCVAVVALLFASLALAGCSFPGANETADENAAANRQFIAQLNNKTNELGSVLSTFQEAVSQKDAVGMKAASSSAEKIIEAVKAMEAPKPSAGARTKDSSEDLNNVKDLYAEGMSELNAVMNDYADLYAGVVAGSLNKQAFDRKLESVQASYEHAIEQLQTADQLLEDLGNDTGSSSGSSGSSSSSSSSSSEASSSEANA